MSEIWIRRTFRRHFTREILFRALALLIMAALAGLIMSLYLMFRKAWEHWK